jgi:hypothetical protein
MYFKSLLSSLIVLSLGGVSNAVSGVATFNDVRLRTTIFPKNDANFILVFNPEHSRLFWSDTAADFPYNSFPEINLFPMLRIQPIKLPRKWYLRCSAWGSLSSMDRL